MKKLTKRMLIGSGVTAAVLIAARQGVANYMAKVALDRKIPPHPAKMEQRMIASCTNAEQLLHLQKAGARLAAQAHEKVRIRSVDGTVLAGHWFPAPQPKRVLIAMHGWRSAWNHDFGIVAEFFQQNGCSVLYAEQRAHGNSGGKHMGFGLTERYDCLQWIRWANQKTGSQLPLYLCGVSMGASTVLMATGLKLPQNVRGVVADCGYTSPTDIWRHVAKRVHMHNAVCTPMHKIAHKWLCIAPDAASCPKALAGNTLPVLFVHGTDDRFVPIEMTYTNFKACAGPKRLFIVPGAEHGMSYLVDRSGYEAALLGFWHEFDEENE